MAAAAAYHVYGKIDQDTRLNEGGTGIEDIHVVRYMVDSGPAKGQKRIVRIPEGDDFTPDGVRAAIEADLANVHGIAGIKG